MSSSLQTRIRRPPLPLTLDYLKALTDDFGLYQHAVFGVPDFHHGYTTDDVARALLVTIRYFELSGKRWVFRLLRKYLAFLQWAQRSDGLFHNLFGIDRKPRDEIGSEDCQGRVFWVLSRLLVSPLPREFKEPARRMLERILPHIPSFQHPRPMAFLLEGLTVLIQGAMFPHSLIAKSVKSLGEKLLRRYQEYADSSWKWFDTVLTWGNALLPAALFKTFELTQEEQYLRVAQESFEFLSKETLANGIFTPIGNRGWYTKGGPRALFDQQPIEAFWMLIAALRASKLYDPEKNRKRALASLEWFLGGNIHHVSLYDPHTGSCADGLTPSGLNENRGAESTIVCLLSLFAAHQAGLRKIQIV